MPFFASWPRVLLRSRLLGLASLLAAVGCAAYLLFGFGYSYETVTSAVSSQDGAISATTTQGWQNALTSARENHDYTIIGWAGFVVLLGVLTAITAWLGRPGPAWVAALLLLALSVLGLLSIGLAVAPVTLLVALTAFALSAARRRGRAAT